MRLPESIRAFIAGATEPSSAALAIAAVVMALVAAWSVQQAEGFVAHYPELLAAGKGDDFSFITSATMDIAATKRDERGVAVIGASCLRAGTDEAMIEQRLRQINPAVRVHNLTTGGQSLWESMAIADYIVPGFAGAVVLDTNPLRFARADDFLLEILREPRLGFRSPLLDELAADANLPTTSPTGVYAWDGRDYLRLRLVNVFPRLLLGSAVHRHDRLTKNLNQEQRERMAVRITSELENYDEGVEVLLAALSKLAMLLSRKNSTDIILVETPIDPHFVDNVIGRDFYDRHIERMRQFAQQHGIQFWELNRELALSERDFADWCHLNNTQAREGYSQLFSAYLAKDLRDSKL